MAALAFLVGMLGPPIFWWREMRNMEKSEGAIMNDVFLIFVLSSASVLCGGFWGMEAQKEKQQESISQSCEDRGKYLVCHKGYHGVGDSDGKLHRYN